MTASKSSVEQGGAVIVELLVACAVIGAYYVAVLSTLLA